MSQDVAVIDIGSNSVRLVIYRLEGRAIWTLHNEKVLAGLGREVAHTGRLSADGIDAALGALRRFSAVLDAAGPSAVFVAATAAVREATDGPAFVARVRSESGFEVRVLSGAEEAHSSAMGVLAGAPEADGVVGDLGGSSLELIRVSGREAHEAITLPLGAFALRASDNFDLDRVRARAARVMESVGPAFEAETLYAVGGSWRNLALLQMRIADYPLSIVHQYEMTAAEALDVARFIARQSRSSLERIEGVSKKRLETMPSAAVVLEQVIQRLGVRRISVSAYGLREGMLFDAMAPEVRALDPLIEGCTALGARQGLSPTIGPALARWIQPVMSALPPLFSGRDAVLAAAACRLADLGAQLHPDHRADLVFEQVLRAPIAGLDHPERAFLAVTLFSRHTASSYPPEAGTLGRILSPERHHRARILGAAIRLGCDLSGRSPELLDRCRLRAVGEILLLQADGRWADLLLGEQTAKRAATLANLLELGLRMSAA
jgi:exopolyphosphatase/guanosine-5'-triphosphate,3'-diphosphate pyrophosphatase